MDIKKLILEAKEAALRECGAPTCDGCGELVKADGDLCPACTVECPDCGVEYVERAGVRLCECNATQDDIDEMEREHMEEGKAFWS